jgi:branched-chain amino acid aminotransferase
LSKAATTTTIDGRPVAPQKACVSVFDNALLYAEGLFETLLVVNDDIIFVDEHLARLANGSKTIGLPIPVDNAKLRHWMHKTARLHPGRVRKLRLTITSGESARWVGRQGKSHVILSAADHSIPTEPYRLWTAPFRVDEGSVFRQIKTISYAINAAAYREADRRGYDDALLLNEREDVAEATSSNIFWIKGGKIYTPPLSAGCLAGVTRRVLFRETGRLGLRLIEKRCSLDELATVDEVFISSSLKLVIGVAEIRAGRRLLKFGAGEITARLRDHFLAMAGAP